MSDNKKYSEEFEKECEDVDEYPLPEFMQEDFNEESEEKNEVKKSEENNSWKKWL